jgi:hypothetical protein
VGISIISQQNVSKGTSVGGMRSESFSVFRKDDPAGSTKN